MNGTPCEEKTIPTLLINFSILMVRTTSILIEEILIIKRIIEKAVYYYCSMVLLKHKSPIDRFNILSTDTIHTLAHKGEEC